MNKTDGGPAFPRQFQRWDHDDCAWKTQEPEEGMTLRDYFAAKAMQALIAAQAPNDLHIRYATNGATDPLTAGAYVYADAMLKARETA
jgi:hypothetical protein